MAHFVVTTRGVARWKKGKIEALGLEGAHDILRRAEKRRNSRPWATLELTTHNVVQRRERNKAGLGLFQHWSRHDLSCRKVSGLEPIIMLKHRWRALGRVEVNRGAHDTYCREGVREVMGFVARTTEPCAKREITCVASS